MIAERREFTLTTQGQDHEIDCIGIMLKLLTEMDSATRFRVLRYLMDWSGDYAKRQKPTE